MTDRTVTAPAPGGPAHRGTDPGRRRRRPTGAPPPLPRKLGGTGKVWLVLIVLLVVWTVVALNVPAVMHLADRTDSVFLRALAELRTPWLSSVMRGIDRVFTDWGATALAFGLLVALVVLRRWRHLLTWIGSLFVLEIVGSTLYANAARPRPYDVTIIGRWAGPSFPSPPVAILATVLMGLVYGLVVAGPSRTWAKWGIGIVLAVFSVARLYLGIDHPSDVVLALPLGIGLPLLAFRFFTPNDVFPVVYRRGKTAHLDIDARRAEAIRRAVSDQLGLSVTEIKPVGLAGSGGSTPLRLQVSGDPDTYVFAKLYTMNHVRADRWYKLGRTILYGRLEDETPFQSVKKLVEYEDYAARLLLDVGIPTATSYGIVELTPGREYLLATEFFDGAEEIGTAEIDDSVIDQGLLLIRRLWDAGLSHRDIKPANLMVRDGQLLLIDVAFMQVRPSPWREAVDLANMMLVLAVRSDAERVYRHALRYFTPDDVAEAFAAARGIASPTQLRMAMKDDGRDLVGQFRALAPQRDPIPLQRWGLRRFVMAGGLVLIGLLAIFQVGDMVLPVRSLPFHGSPDCGTDKTMILAAQSVPRATVLPCIATLPSGWRLEQLQIRRGRTRFVLGSDRAGDHAVQVTLTPPEKCDVSGAEAVPSGAVGARRFERPDRLEGLRSTRYDLFEGGCVTYRFVFDEDAPTSVVFEADQALGFQERGSLVEEVDDQTGLRLCGAGAPCPGGTAPS